MGRGAEQGGRRACSSVRQPTATRTKAAARAQCSSFALPSAESSSETSSAETERACFSRLVDEAWAALCVSLAGGSSASIILRQPISSSLPSSLFSAFISASASDPSSPAPLHAVVTKMRGAASVRKRTPHSAVGRAIGVGEKREKGSHGGPSGLGSPAICALRTRLVAVPTRVHMPPSIDANESGISRMCSERSERTAHSWQSEMSMATTGVLLRNAERRVVGTQRRSSAPVWPFGEPRAGRSTSCTALVSSSAFATTNRTPMVRMDGEEKPFHA